MRTLRPRITRRNLPDATPFIRNSPSGLRAHVMALIETYRRTLETTELEARVAALEGGKE